jgi:signal transduction histidine kinase
MKDYKTAFENAEKYRIINDSVHSIEKTKIIKDLKIKHESDLKETEILTQKKLIETKNSQNTGLLIGFSLILISMLSMFFLYKKRLSIQKKLLKKQEELADEKMNTVLEKQKVKTFQSHIEGQNKERERIAKDLHDSVSGNLAAIKMKLSTIEVNNSAKLDAIILNLDTTYNEVRTISHNLLPQEIVNLSFTENINQLVLLYQSEKLKIDVAIFPEEEINKLSQKIEVELYRILQELITTMAKHAKATKCTISITLHNNYLNVIIEDNGVGYNITKKSKGIGLTNIASRINSVKGSLDIDSLKGKGTTVNINIPTN